MEYAVERNRYSVEKSPVVAATIIAFASIRKISSHAERKVWSRTNRVAHLTPAMTVMIDNDPLRRVFREKREEASLKRKNEQTRERTQRKSRGGDCDM